VAPITVKRGNFRRIERADGPLSNHDIQSEVFHSRVEHLQSSPQAVNFVDKQDIAGPAIGRDSCQVGQASIAGPEAVTFDIYAHLIGQICARVCLSQAGRAIKQDVIQRFIALASGID
jgi:hypothetical protein